MALPNRLRSARMTNATLGSSIDDEVGFLEKALCDLLGIPIDTDLAAALFSTSAAGLLSIILQNASANPTLAGQLMRNNTRLMWHNTERAVELQPAGELKWFFGTSAPAGWLLCDGTAYSRTTYARLFATIGILGGPGDGSTTFNVPDIKGRVLVGLDAAGDPDFDTIGKTPGEKTHVLTTAEMPSHDHAASASVSDPGHAHSYFAMTPTAPGAAFGSNLVNTPTDTSTNVTGITVGVTVASNGSGAAHNNVQRSLVAAAYIST